MKNKCQNRQFCQENDYACHKGCKHFRPLITEIVVMPFTTQDVAFLKSLHISVGGAQ